ncbi:hypothetical protein [Lactovum miscens]|uniref:Poly-beta-1,6-N-acetyl-D-glucosamine biosynthesis protein PgaD n=1 Tax=Lactovum miscens TaxID=190387 RepID=A0A841CA08_9LACT|nr:hypothetical protein [Lactovum miscens]MBB5888401.1 hypothetical protein [Lactovum miscens]
MKKINNINQEKNFSYSDLFFEKGNYILKIKQLLLALVGWFCFIVPTFITIDSFLYYLSKEKYGWMFWDYSEGIIEIKFLLVVLSFCVIITFLYAISMTIIQNNRRESVIEKWPTFDSVSSIERGKNAEKFIEERFGEEKFRHNVKYFEVVPEKNLPNNELSKAIRAEMDDYDK